jgi:hypothetical protein
MKSLAQTAGVLALVAMAHTAQASYIYNNSTNDLGQRLVASDGLWFGDELILDGTDRFMTHFDFQFWATNTSGLTIDVELRLQDGTPYNGYPSPGTLIYGYYGFGLSDTPRSTLNFDIADLDLFDGLGDGGTYIAGNVLTLAIRFNNIGSGQAGVDLYTPVDVGGSYPDYWQFVSGQWQLTTNNVFSTVNFGARIEAIPEPTAFAILTLAGVLGLAGRRYLRK